jgi:hypothetical protein
MQPRLARPTRSHRPVRRAHRATTCLVGALAFVLAACGGGGSDDGNLLETFAAAAETTGSASSMHMDMTVTFEDVPGVPDDGMVTSSDVSMDGLTGRGVTTTFDQEIEFLMVDDHIYYAIPGLPDGATWLRLTYDDLAEFSGVDVSAASEQSPTEVLARLQASGDIERVGEEDLDGVATTRYRAVIDVDRLGDDGVVSEAAIEQLRGLTGDTYEMDVWIDGDGYLRRMSYAIDLANAPEPPAGMPSEGSIQYDITMSDFGAPLDVTAPPEDEVVDFADIN